jgi:hypothetical protein
MAIRQCFTLGNALFVFGAGVFGLGCGSSESNPSNDNVGGTLASTGVSTATGGYSAVLNSEVHVGGQSSNETNTGSGGTTTVSATNAQGGITVGGGTKSAGGASSSGGMGGASPGKCGSTTLQKYPFGCKFAWGIADPGGALTSYSYLQFVSYWVDSSISASGAYTVCNGCNWLTKNVANTNLIPAYYAYIIGFLAHANGIVDGNQTGSKKLTTDGAALVKANRAAIISAYAWYAQKTAAVWPTKPLVWLLEGDFIQLADAGQSSPMTMAEVGQLAADITCAIKSNMPNAVVAMDHSTWNSNDVTNSFWGAMKNVNYDMVWTTGVANNKGFLESTATSSSYNAATATYSYLHTLTGRSILVDTSAGASAASDSWSTASTTDLNARISEGVIAANITGTAPTNLQGNLGTITPSLNGIPACL